MRMKKTLYLSIIFVFIFVNSFSTFALSQDELDAKNAVLTAETTGAKSDFDIASNLVNNLPDPTESSINLITIPEVNEPVVVVDDTWFTVTEADYGGSLNTYINDLLDQGETNFFIKDGTYNLNSHILIDVPGIRIKGESKEGTKIIQTSEADDGLVVRADDVIVTNLTLDTREFHAKSAFTQASSNNVILYDCIINGADDCFAVFFAGRDFTAGAETLEALENGNLDTNNMVLKNTVNSTFWGDGLSFSLQKDGICQNNIVNGTKIAFYMCRDSFVVNNEINDSQQQGIYYSVPAHDNVIANNIISNSTTAGIKTSKELEHGSDNNARGSNVQIYNNTIINSGNFGLEIDLLNNSIIYNNTIKDTGKVGIYMLRSEFSTIKDNIVINPAIDADDGVVDGWSSNLVGGLFADYHIQDSIFDGNIFENSYNNCNFAIKTNSGALNERNSIINNIIRGEYVDKLQLGGTDETISIKADLLDRLASIAYTQTEIILTTETDAQYSDSTNIQAELIADGTGISGKSIEFKSNGTTIGTAVTNVDGIANLNYNVNLPSDSYTITANFYRDETDRLEESAASTVLNVLLENAILDYTGQYIVQNTEPLTMSAMITQEDDGSIGSYINNQILFKVNQINEDGSYTFIGEYTSDCNSNGEATLIQSFDVGVYSVVATLLENNYFVSCETTESIIPVYDPTSGHACGGGLINVDDQSSGNIGKARFGFTTKYKDGEAKGNFKFNYKDGNLKIKSKDINWLMINDTNTQFEGTATMRNQEGIYTYRVNCIDNGDNDTFSITIWEGTDTNADPIYVANNMSLSKGKIKIKK
ncbi:MAG: post-COAP-1 domain-containing protein [Clostridiales bacterium]